jgi:hypothetical protein
MSYAVYQYFLNGGKDAIIIRVFQEKLMVVPSPLVSTTLASGITEADLSITVGSYTNFPPPPASFYVNIGSETLLVTSVNDAPHTTWKVLRHMAGTKAADALKDAVITLASPVNSEGTAIFSVEIVDNTNAQTSNTLYLASAYPGTWGRNIEFEIDSKPENLNEDLLASDPSLFNLTVKLYDSPVVQTIPTSPPLPGVTPTATVKRGTQLITEKFQNVSLNPASFMFIKKVLEQDSQLLRVASTIAGTTLTFPSFPTVPKLPSSSFSSMDSAKNLVIQLVGYDPKDPTKYGSSLNSATPQPTGDNGDPLTAANIIPSEQSKKTGLFALEDADLFNLLCIPPYNDADSIFGGPLYTDVYPNAIQYCIGRRAMLLVDPPSDWTSKKNVTDSSKGINSLLTRYANAAFFFPCLTMSDPLKNNKLAEFVPCGAVAGVIATTDSQRGIWKAPAGIDASLNGVSDLTLQDNPVRLTDSENGDLNPLGVNCLRIMPVVGPVVWGSRTMKGDDRHADQWKYLPVRRTALYIEESLYRGIQWVVFEPNDEPLWSQIRLNIGAFMHGLFVKGAFQGSTPKDAYFVKCDSETTTQTDINNGIVNIIVGFAPLRPAEFVILKIQQMAGQEVS